MKTPVFVTIFILGLTAFQPVKAQEDKMPILEDVLAVSDKFLSALDKKSLQTKNQLQSATEKYLSKLSKRERKLRKILVKKDSLLAKQVFGDIDYRYNNLRDAAKKLTMNTSAYSGRLDSLTTILHFLQNDKLSSKVNNPGFKKSITYLNSLQDKFNQTAQIRTFLDLRVNLLKEQFRKLGMEKKLKKYRKEVYYYQAQVNEYKTMFENPGQFEEQMMKMVRAFPQFKKFFARYSQFASFFPISGGIGGAANNPAPSIQGLQTRSSISQFLQNQFGSNAAITQKIQKTIQEAQTQSAGFKDVFSKYNNSSLGNDDGSKEIPGFKVNTQRTKSFFERMEIGSNIQSQKARSFFPVMTDLGLSVGYKVNAKSLVGFGVSYKLGWGSGWNKIKFTQQGIGVRSFADYKIKDNFFLSGGYEQNYLAAFQHMEQLRNYSAWQASGLIGLSKKYAVSKKLKGDIKFLWDFLSYRQIPRSQPVLFRIGYNFK